MTRIALIFILSFGCVLGVHADARGTLTLSGTVQPSVSLSVRPKGSHLSLLLATTATDDRIAVFTETSNQPYSVTVGSANGGAMIGETAANGGRVPYTLKYGTTSSLSFIPSRSGSLVTPTGTRTGTDGVSKGLYISFSAANDLNADAYRDTLIITITAR